MKKYPNWLINTNLSISQLEMVNAMAAVRIYAKDMTKRVVRLRCDNSATVSVLATGKGKCPILLACARAVWKCTAEHDIVLQVKHIVGKDNSLADQLSRAHLTRNAYTGVLTRAKEENAKLLYAEDSLFEY